MTTTRRPLLARIFRTPPSAIEWLPYTLPTAGAIAWTPPTYAPRHLLEAPDRPNRGVTLRKGLHADLTPGLPNWK